MAKLETRLSSNRFRWVPPRGVHVVSSASTFLTVMVCSTAVDCGVGRPHLASLKPGKRRRCWVSVLVELDACL